MAKNLNQFQQTAERGQIALLTANSPVISAVVDSTETGTLKAGDAVKLVSTSVGIPHVVKCGVSDTTITGFVVFNPVKNDSIVANDRIEIATTGAFIYQVASTSIVAGAALDYNYSTGKVATANSGLACGVALDAAAADGDLIRVAVKADI